MLKNCTKTHDPSNTAPTDMPISKTHKKPTKYHLSKSQNRVIHLLHTSGTDHAKSAGSSGAPPRTGAQEKMSPQGILNIRELTIVNANLTPWGAPPPPQTPHFAWRLCVQHGLLRRKILNTH